MKHRWAIVMLVAGCGGPPAKVSLDAVTQAPTPSEYVDQIKKWTRHGHVIADFDDTLAVDATLHSPEFRAAYAEKWIWVYKLGPDDAARMRSQLTSQIAESWEFHAETSGHVWEVNDLVEKRNIWRVMLMNDQGRSVSSTEIKLVKDRPEVDAEFYPYAGLFTKPWTMRFPHALPDGTPLVNADTKSLTLRVAGPKGTIDLVWQLR